MEVGAGTELHRTARKLQLGKRGPFVCAALSYRRLNNEGRIGVCVGERKIE